MKRRTPLCTAAMLLLTLPFLASVALAQPGPPFGGDGPPGEPGGPPSGWSPGDGPPPWAGPPTEPPSGNGDDDNENGNGPPPFCSSDGAPSGPSGQAGVSSIAHVNFSQVDAEGEFLEEGAWARMMYRWRAPVFDFVFNAHELAPDDEYTLTYQPEPFPSPGVICLGTATVNEEGDLHLEDAFDIDTDLPALYDENEEEATLALVVAAHVNCETGDMSDWTPEEYLFTEEGIIYVDSDLDPEEEGEE